MRQGNAAGLFSRVFGCYREICVPHRSLQENCKALQPFQAGDLFHRLHKVVFLSHFPFY